MLVLNGFNKSILRIFILLNGSLIRVGKRENVR